MDLHTLTTLHDVFDQLHGIQDWKITLDKLFVSLRGEFVFDNVAIYLVDPQTSSLEVAYARAVGRGKTAEADVAWGETFANEVFAKEKMLMQHPVPVPQETDRLLQAYLLGFPMYIGSRLEGVIVFIRFGGPEYSETHIRLASLQAYWAMALIERKALKEARSDMESVQRQMRLQDDFVSTISHELRTPLGFIKGYSTSLLRQDTSWDEGTQREFLTIIDEEADRLTKLIEDMLESARLESKTMQFKFSPVRLDGVIRDVAQRVTTLHSNLRVVFDIQPLEPISADSLRISQVFENLFSNAVKYAPGANIHIGMQMVDAELRISFADQGPGIAEAYLPFLFERFYRVPGVRTEAGTGLGLYICRQIILAHHGKIWVESVLGRGTTFFIELPAHPPV
ncbi:MAG: HAMP domain-containing histidine kinase [Chloroflexi bacterium]|nr:HAMP domain-containing histidine kinase [Chloroflexota bacterium]